MYFFVFNLKLFLFGYKYELLLTRNIVFCDLHDIGYRWMLEFEIKSTAIIINATKINLRFLYFSLKYYKVHPGK